MSQLTFSYPIAFLFVLLLPVVVYLALAGRRRIVRRDWLGLGLRCAMMILLISALAGPRIGRQEDKLAVVFLIDASDSLGAESKALAFRFVKEAIGRMGERDAAGVVVFGGDALVERTVSPDKSLEPLESAPGANLTDIGAAVRLAMALFPASSAKRMVILSDGNDKGGSTEQAVRLARASGAEVSVVPLLAAAGREILVDRVEAPSRVREGERFDLKVTVVSSLDAEGTLRLFGDGLPLAEETVRLQRGENRFVFPVTARDRGFWRFSAQIAAAADTFPQNNEAGTFTTVWGKPRVLLVARDSREALSLLPALKSTQVDVEVQYPDQLTYDVTKLSSYDSIILSNVPAGALGDRMKTIQAYVRDLGKGLTVIGGEESYGTGQYYRTPLEEALPVTMDYRSQLQSPNVSIVLAVDKSGSMSRCHCGKSEFPAENYLREEGGVSKIELVKEAIYKAAEALSTRDEIGVVAFDSVARWAFPTQPLGDPQRVGAAVGGLRAEGGTNVYAGLDEAVKSLKNSKARNKHIVLLTDGWSRTGNFEEVVRQMREAGITLSTVGAGGGAADLLRDLAVAGGGRFYAADDVDSVPQIFAKEAQLTQRSLLVEEPFYPAVAGASPILQGIGGLPRLEGYVATTPKATAQLVLVSPEGDPVLAQWQYGLGRVLAWTSDAKSKWAKAWVNWEGFPRFWSQAVRWTLPGSSATGLQGRARIQGTQGQIEVDAAGQGGELLNSLKTRAVVVSPGLSRQEVPLRQKAPGLYEGKFEALETGSYLVQIAQEKDGELVGATTTGAVLSYSPEYRDLEPNPGLLKWIAELGKGRTMSSPDETLVHNLGASLVFGDQWPLLVALALLLLPVDIGVRRLMLGRKDIERARQYVRNKLRRRTAPAQPSPEMSRLLRAKVRRRGRYPDGLPDPADIAPPQTTGQPEPGMPGGEKPANPAVEQPAPDETLARLLRAKGRGRPKGRKS
ncbi:MAG: VWA domain-containing protein [Chloroflexi bacterium]|nr:VWA domain-containing protein [Chloroflexota bacterium]